MTDNLRDRIANVAGDFLSDNFHAYLEQDVALELADAVIEELGLRYEYENGRVLYTYKPKALSGNGNWKFRVSSDLKLYEGD